MFGGLRKDLLLRSIARNTSTWLTSLTSSLALSTIVNYDWSSTVWASHQNHNTLSIQFTHKNTHFFINLCIYHTSLWHRNTTGMTMLFQMGIPYSVSNGKYTNPAHTQTRYNQTTKQPDTLSSPIVFFFHAVLVSSFFSFPFFSFSSFFRFLFLLFLFNVVLLASGAVRVRTRTVFLLG